MNASLIFSVPEPIDKVIPKCRETIAQLGAPLKSDSGHYVTGVLHSGHNNVDVRVTWLVDTNAIGSGDSTQITVAASHETCEQEELENLAQRFKHQYLSRAKAKPKSNFRITAGSVLFAAGALVVISAFIFLLAHHKG